jgi:prepilin-type N-terminal cleavage/methylation domain-containing protein
MKPQRGFTLIELVLCILLGTAIVACGYGYIHNIVLAFREMHDGFTWQIAFRIFGIPMLPLGIVLGYL